jgi:hypothetical protein
MDEEIGTPLPVMTPREVLQRIVETSKSDRHYAPGSWADAVLRWAKAALEAEPAAQQEKTCETCGRFMTEIIRHQLGGIRRHSVPPECPICHAPQGFHFVEGILTKDAELNITDTPANTVFVRERRNNSGVWIPWDMTTDKDKAAFWNSNSSAQYRSRVYVPAIPDALNCPCHFCSHSKAMHNAGTNSCGLCGCVKFAPLEAIARAVAVPEPAAQQESVSTETGNGTSNVVHNPIPQAEIVTSSVMERYLKEELRVANYHLKTAREEVKRLNDRARQAEPAPTPSRLHPADLRRLSRIFEANREVAHIWPTGAMDKRIHEWLSIQLAEASSLGARNNDTMPKPLEIAERGDK